MPYEKSLKNPDGDNTLDASFDITTLKGDKTNGFYGHTRYYNNSAGADQFKGCTGADTDCNVADIDSLVATDALASSFYGSASRTEWATQVEDGLPPCYDDNDLTFDALPTTDAFGVCK